VTNFSTTLLTVSDVSAAKPMMASRRFLNSGVNSRLIASVSSPMRC